jgi:L-rhamnose mutarotase
MQRVAQTIRLRPERREEYLRLHASVWPGVEAALRAANIRNYSNWSDLALVWHLSEPAREP